MTMLAFVDLETGGLPTKNAQDMPPILEIAVVVTDNDLRTLGSCDLVVHKSEVVLGYELNEWCRETHKASGLWDDCLNSSHSEADVEHIVMQFLVPFLDSNGSTDEEGNFKRLKPPMCGNTVHFDRHFLQVHMPRLEALFHYRNVDVSTIKELAKVWGIPEYKKEGGAAHRALDDIKHSIEELAYYRRFITSNPLREEVLDWCKADYEADGTTAEDVLAQIEQLAKRS